MKRVYIASPYAIGDQAVNVRRQMDCADELMNLDFVPYAPLYSHFQHMVHPRSAEDWYKFDNEWVKACHYLLRLPGKSKGADDEVELAEEFNIPVFYSIDELVVERSKDETITTSESVSRLSQTQDITPIGD